MPPDPAATIKDSIRNWSGVECPNEAGRIGLGDFAALIQELDSLRGTMVFEDEPSSFEAALISEQEKSA